MVAQKRYDRSSDYRRNFFKNNPGLFGTDKYQCVYCGRIKSKRKIQVDHHIPVHRVKRFGIGRLLMKMKNINDINSIKNLVPACEKCNKKKSSKMGLWLIKGVVGKHFGWWIFVWLTRLALILFILYIVLLISDGYNIFESIPQIEKVSEKISQYIVEFTEKIKTPTF